MNEQDELESYTRKRPQKSKGKKIAVGICIGLAVLLVLLMLASLIFSMWSVIRRAEMQVIPDYGYGYDYGGDGYFGYEIPYDDSQDSGSSGYYVPSPDDQYYRELTDATDRDLSYGVIWQSISMRPDDPKNTYQYDCSYPVLTGEEEKKLASANKEIERIACEYKDVYQDYAGGVLSYGYVTYMDEEKISVVIRHSLNDGKKTDSIVRAVTFRMDTGEIMPHSEMVDTDEYLVYQFRSRNTFQNGEVEFVEKLSDEELLAYLLDEEDSIMFYTPVGLEIGFNFDDGWVTVTLKSYVV